MYFINRYIVHIVVAIMLLCSANIKWGKDHWKQTILSDGKGYYIYLPAVIIYHDLSLSFVNDIEQKYYYEHTRYDVRSYLNERAFSKYSMGVAILLLPFFLIAHVFSLLFGFSPDGYSQPYAISVCLGAIFYLGVGLTYLKKILSLYKTSAGIKTVIIVAFTFGTSLFYYTIVEPAMSHVYSFAAISMFIYYSKVYFKTGMYKYIVRLSLILGVVVAIKTLNVLILFCLPFLAEEWSIFENATIIFLKKIKNVITISLFPLFLIFLQWYFYFIQTGTVLTDSYRGESFNFFDPHFIDILFSYRKGLFVYTPLLLICLGGLIVLFRKNKYEFFSFLMFFIFLTYILSCWWRWYYGGSYGLRAYIEYYSLFAILLAVLMNELKNSFKVIAVAFVLLLTIVCQVQTYQYRYYHIHWSEMNKEKYWDVFLRIDKLI